MSTDSTLNFTTETGKDFAVPAFMNWNHWIARTSTPLEPFRDAETARWTWDLIKKLFPESISAVLMPNHFHLLLPNTPNKPTHLNKMVGLLGAISKHTGHRDLWQKIPKPAAIPDKFHLRRQVRYIALNPCRKSLCSDPLEWYWSTYREVMGATDEKTQMLERLALSLGESPKNFRVRFHAYVSGDPSVQVSGTSFPQAASPTDWSEVSIGEILSASAAALRVSPLEVKRKSKLRPLFIHLASRHGWASTSTVLAQICETTPRSIYLILNKNPPSSVSAAELCLGDVRLRRKGPFPNFLN